jgi:hypothetical protein
MLREYRDDHGGIFRTLAFVDRRGLGLDLSDSVRRSLISSRRIGAEAVILAVLTRAIAIDFVLSSRGVWEFANPKNPHCFPMATL